MVTKTDTDKDALTISFTTELDAGPERVWELWADPRQLEKWWGPPGYPATFTRHDLSEGAEVRYFMTGPEGDKYHGWWEVLTVDGPHRIEFRDGFGDENGEPSDTMPKTVSSVTIESLDADADGTTTRMTILGTYESVEGLDHVLDMGVVEGMTMALNQIDDLLREDD
jgi:uncharacterized protein YndB with AHSA1/START domain